jgi:hypothetical protein
MASPFGPTPCAAADDVYNLATDWFATQIYIGDYGHGGLRWTNVTVPAGATITSATITMRARNLYGTVTNVHVRIYGDKTGNASAWPTASGTSMATELAETDTYVDWNPSAWSVGSDYSVAVTTIVAEIVALPAWATGQAMRFGLMNNGSSTDAALRCYDQTDDATYNSRLTIEYTDPVAGSIVPQIQYYRQQQ